MKRHHYWFVVACISLLVGCAREESGKAAEKNTGVQARPEDAWIGIYSSPSEIGIFSGTVLAIEKDRAGHLGYRKTFYSDVQSDDSTSDDEMRGSVRYEGDKLYVHRVSTYRSNGETRQLKSVDRYTRRIINGRVVLLRDDALKAYEEKNGLYDYGVLIKVANKVDRLTKLDDAKHESIKVLYSDPSKDWKDPFVNGPNKR